ncbi:MAG TPA: hypothetical protein VGI96_46450 [Streptosporangiaceae bacterium]|jgi:ABC-type Fe3+ transport system permease subunit
MSRFRRGRQRIDSGDWDRGPRRRWRPRRSRARGCLMFVLLLIVILIVLAVAFGGFQKGTKSGSLSRLCTSCLVTPIPAGPWPAGIS